jgi:hypothetical protein
MAQLLNLPPELLIHAFAYLPFNSLLRLSSTSKVINELISTSVVLQYVIWLGSSSHCDNPTATSVAHSLQALKQGEEGWSEWKVRKLTHLEVNHRPSGIYDLTCGILILGESCLGRTTNALQWVDLREGKDMIWNRLDLQANIIDLALNVHEWDLISIITTSVFVSPFLLFSKQFLITCTGFRTIVSPDTWHIQAHLLQLSTSKGSNAQYHPLALQPILPILSHHTRHGRCALSMEIVGAHLALLLTFPYSFRPVEKLYIFDWRTGKMIFVRSIFHHRHDLRRTLNNLQTRQAEKSTYNSLTFLSEDVLLLPNLTDNTLELCSFSRPGRASSHTIETILDGCQQINTDFANAMPLRTTVTLKLPQWTPHTQLAMLACRGEPTPYSATCKPTCAGQDGPWFRPLSESAIVIFNIMLEDDIALRLGHVSSVSFVVHRKALLDQMEVKGQDHPSTPTPTHLEGTVPCPVFPSLASVAELGRIVPWTEWGPLQTRWFHTNDMSTRWITTTCGQRWVTVQDGRSSSIFIRDFNPVNIKRVIANLGETRSYETNDAMIKVVDTPSSVSHDLEDTFEEQLESHLPYLEIETKKKYTYSSVFMSESWLLGILVRILLFDPCWS